MPLNFNIEYRPKEQFDIPSARSINGEPVWAEIMDSGEDLVTVYVTKKDDAHWHIWIAYATDDPAQAEFHQVYAYGGHAENDTGPADYPMYVKALEAATDIAGD